MNAGDLIALASRLAGSDGIHAHPGLAIHRHSLPRAAHVHDLSPRFTIILQGAKRLDFAAGSRAWSAAEYAVVTQRTPVVSAVTQAAPRAPYLSMMVELDPAVVAEVVERARPTVDHSLALSPVTPPLVDALADLLCAAPHAQHELVARLVDAGHAAALRRLADRAVGDPVVARAIAWLEEHVSERLSIARLARAIGASTSALHHRFKLATQTSPLQYHKRLRLERARRLIALHAFGPAQAARAVGYASAAHFSRDYHRAFARPPSRDRAPEQS